MFDRSEWPGAGRDPADAAAAASAATQPLALDDLAQPLERLLAEVAPSHRHRVPALIIYTSSGAATSVHACPAGAGSGQAMAAGRLGLASVVNLPLDLHPSDVRVLHTDPSGKASAVAGARPPRIHTLAVADADEHVAAFSAWASAAGLQVLGVVPAEAAYSAAAVSAALEQSGTNAVLWMGLHQSVVAVTAHGRLELVRTVRVGTESLVDSLLRPIRGQTQADMPSTALTLTREQARQLLTRAGIPNITDDLPDLPGYTGASVLPLLQPALQRLAVEIKQSLRFGTAESDRAQISLLVAGDGAAVPRLENVLSTFAGIPRPSSPSSIVEPGPLAAVIAGVSSRLPRLLSGAEEESLLTRGLRRGLVAGVAAAGLLLTIEALSAFAALAEERDRLEAIRSNAAGQQALAHLQDRAIAARIESASLHNRMSHMLGEGPDWAATMAVISQHAPASIRVLDLDMHSDDAKPQCRLRGYVRLATSVDAPDAIRDFVNRLSDSPIVTSVRLGATQRTELRGEDVQAFELVIALLPLPHVEQPEPALTTTAPGVADQRPRADSTTRSGGTP